METVKVCGGCRHWFALDGIDANIELGKRPGECRREPVRSQGYLVPLGQNKRGEQVLSVQVATWYPQPVSGTGACTEGYEEPTHLDLLAQAKKAAD